MKNTVFANDPMAMMAQAFEELYPKKKYIARIVDRIVDENDNEKLSGTAFPKDGGVPIILVSAQADYINMIGAFSQELAHVAAGAPKAGTDGRTPEWKTAMNVINRRYQQIVQKNEETAQKAMEAMEAEGSKDNGEAERALQGVQEQDG
ncbi:MAG: hypothetical protein GX418_12095 [Clostridiales bacterium]|nr:hypothetical protein [Clostridiales bacterium]